MQSAVLKRIIFLFSLLISLIVLAQLYWLNKIYSFEQRQFTTNVVKAVRGLFEDIVLSYQDVVHLQQLVERPDANTFLVRIDTIPQKDSLYSYLTAEMEDFDVFADCMVSVYEHSRRGFAYNVFLPMAGTRNPRSKVKSAAAPMRDYDYIQLLFPRRTEYILNEMRWWIIAGVILLLALSGLAASLFYLYKQKFLNEVQADFIKNVTHEFQTPLTTLKLGLDMISRPNIRQQPDKLDKYTSVMQSQTQYLQHHLENLVKVIRTDSNAILLHKESVIPGELVLEVIHQLHFLAEEKSGVIEFVPPEEDMAVTADRQHLFLAVLNVVSNSLKYSQRPHVIISVAREDRYIVFSVRDNGIGIERKYMKLLFKKFYRIPTGDVHNVKGLGLGLYFVKKIVSLHRGRVEVASKPRAGTEFRIILPMT